ncbi:MAG: CBS domain-containing protein [Pirellulaceae bacterium]
MADVAQRLRNFHRDVRGATAVENAVLITLILGVLLLAVEGVALLAGRTFDSASLGLSHESTHVAQHVERAAKASAGAEQTSPTTASGLSPYARIWVLLIVCPFSAACWYLLHRARRGCKNAEEETPASEDGLELDHDAIFQKRHEILRILSADVGILLDSRMHVRHVMSRKLSTIEPTAPAQQVRERMRKERIRHLIVCQSDGRLMGVISDRDLGKMQAQTARQMMTPQPLTVDADALISPAITLLIERRISCLPVLDGERLVGVLTTTDLMMALQCALHALQKVAAEIAKAHDRPQRRSISDTEQIPVAARG